MGAAPSIFVPRWQVDSKATDAIHRFANPTVREALKERLLQESYSSSIREGGEVNTSMQEALLSVVGTRNIEYVSEAETTIEDEDDGAMTKRRLALECLIGFISRLRNPNIHNFFIVTLSILALACGVSVQFWAILSMMGIAFSRTWTIELVREIGDEVAARKPVGCSETVGLAVADNKAYHVHTAHVHAEEVEGITTGPRIANGYFLYTVNNIQVPLNVGVLDMAHGKKMLTSL